MFPRSTASDWPRYLASHSRVVVSWFPVANTHPFGCHAAAKEKSRCPSIVAILRPVPLSTSHASLLSPTTTM
jgi:hypothetical protein